MKAKEKRILANTLIINNRFSTNISQSDIIKGFVFSSNHAECYYKELSASQLLDRACYFFWSKNPDKRFVKIANDKRIFAHN